MWQKAKNAWKGKGWGSRIFRGVVYLFLAQLAYVVLIRFVNPPTTVIQMGDWVRCMREDKPFYRDYVPLSAIGPQARLAVMASEDHKFVYHYGFDLESVAKAAEHNADNPEKIIGASTISQQVVKNVFLWKGSNLLTRALRKGMELYLTPLVELLYPKHRILELYLNCIEMGDGVYGIESAAQLYFGKPAREINQREAAMIAASLPNPKIYTVVPLSPKVKRKLPYIQRNMNRLDNYPEVRELMQYHWEQE